MYSPTITEFVFEAILTRFRADAAFYQVFFEACGQVVLLREEPDNPKPDISSRFLQRGEVLAELSRIKHRAFDFLEDILR